MTRRPFSIVSSARSPRWMPSSLRTSRSITTWKRSPTVAMPQSMINRGLSVKLPEIMLVGVRAYTGSAA